MNYKGFMYFHLVYSVVILCLYEYVSTYAVVVDLWSLIS